MRRPDSEDIQRAAQLIAAQAQAVMAPSPPRDPRFAAMTREEWIAAMKAKIDDAKRSRGIDG